MKHQRRRRHHRDDQVKIDQQQAPIAMMAAGESDSLFRAANHRPIPNV
jgi:hypothetical protein